MRPGSRGALGSSAGGPPGTGGVRPGSGRRPPGTGRLRTGMAQNTGPGMQAAQGVSLTASINVSDRPVTGQGVMGMKTQANGPGRLVQDPSYYVGILRKKINDVATETKRLNTEMDQYERDQSQMIQLEKRYDTLAKAKEQLEGQLADYNLAMDKTRTSTDPEDVQQMAIQLAGRNRQTGQELDRIFVLRKQRETETNQLNDQIQQYYQSIQSRINELEPGKLRSYHELMEKQKELQTTVISSENRLNEINNAIRQVESDEKGYSHRKEYTALEKQVADAKRNYDSLSEELEIASLDPKEAHAKFVARVNDHKKNTKAMEEQISSNKTELRNLRQQLEDLTSSSFNQNEEDSSETAKYDLLVKRDQEMMSFIDKFDEVRGGILAEQQQAKSTITGLLEHIGTGIDDSTNLPDADVKAEMEDAKVFKERNLATAKKTMESLTAERNKREKELEMLRSSEPKLIREIAGLKDAMIRMNAEVKEFSNVDAVNRKFDRTQRELQELRKSYVKRRDSIRQQIQGISAESESLKKQLASNDTDKELEETEKRLKHYERTIFDVREFIESKSRETDYELVRGTCLRMTDSINAACVQASQTGGTQPAANPAGRW
jgi:intraflagellar transport protein 74